MALPLYLAMTPAEISGNPDLPEPLAYMACHFSPWGRGLCNQPEELPRGSAILLNDRIPYKDHDPEEVAAQLGALASQFQCSCVLLDFQRPGWEACGELAKLLISDLPCPVGVSPCCGQDLDCPVFLPPASLDRALKGHLAPWNGRDIWLDLSYEGLALGLTAAGCTAVTLPYPQLTGGFAQEELHIHYLVEQQQEEVIFSLYRTEQDLRDLTAEAESLGVTRCFGLWQELGSVQL